MINTLKEQLRKYKQLCHAYQLLKEDDKVEGGDLAGLVRKTVRDTTMTRSIKVETRRPPRTPTDPSTTSVARLVIFAPSALILRRKKEDTREIIRMIARSSNTPIQCQR
jgi:hypothetical protein